MYHGEYIFMFKNRHSLKRKDARRIAEKLHDMLGCKVEKEMETAEYKDWKMLFINGKIYGFFINDIPFLNVEGLKVFKAERRKVVVDDGAIKFILNGADVMAPGIVNADENIKKKDVVWVSDERGLPLAVGIALMDGAEMVNAGKGKAVKNIHHIGDEIWKLSKV